MPKPDDAAPEEWQKAIEERKLAIEERRIALEETSAKKWAGYVLPVMATISTAIISAAVTLTTTYVADVSQKIESDRLESQKQIENNRAALDLYFGKLSGKEMGLHDEYKVNASIIELKMLATVTGSVALNNLLNDLSQAVLESNKSSAAQDVNSDPGRSTPEAAQLKISNAAAGLPDFTQAPANGDYKAADFLAYPQAPIGTDDVVVSRMLNALSALGFKVRGVQRMKPGISPSQNEVRYYLPEHKRLAEQIAQNLGQSFGQPFVARPVNIGKTLPNGIMEFWLAEKK